MNFCITAVVLAQFAVISFADVIGGRDAVDGERPFQVALFAKGSFCGGALIHPRVVVTAAHCVVGKTVTHIRYNTLRRSTGPTIDVIRTIVFPDYNKETHEHDIALVILKEAFKPGKNARVIETVGVDAAAGSTVTLSGWGNTIAGGGVQESESLKVANLTEVDRQTCDKQWGNRNSISPYQICASGTTTSACNGDSGGPLTWNGKLYGIVSYGPKPCKLGSPSNVYTRVGSYLAFIKDNKDRVKSF